MFNKTFFLLNAQNVCCNLNSSFFLSACISVSQSSILADSIPIQVRCGTTLVCDLARDYFDKMAVDTMDVSSIGLFNEMSFQLVTIRKKVNGSFMKKYDNARIKNENRLVLAYQAILSSGAHNSFNFQPI